MLNITMNENDDELTVGLEGRLDATVADNLEKQLEGPIEGKKGLTFDFEKLEYVSSAGLRVILWAQDYMEERGNGNVVIINANDFIKDVFNDTGFNDILDIK